MISFFVFTFLFTFVTCKSFHANQHLPVQTYQTPLKYRPFDYYPNIPTIPVYRPPSPTKEGITDEPNSQQLSDLERQYQQWQIAVPSGQPGVVWISAPQYSYYPPPPNGSPPNYPPPPPYPYPPGPGPYPSPYPIPAPESNNTQSEIQEINPTQGRETVYPATRPNPTDSTTLESITPSENITLSPIETPTPSPSEPTSTSSPTTEGTTFIPPIENITSSVSPSENITTTTAFVETSTNATEIPTTESSTNTYSTTTTTTSTTQRSSTTTQNSTTTSTTSAPQNTTSNSTNPLLKYCKKPRGQFPSEDCGKFVNCWDDVAVEQSCPSGLLFNPDKQYCDYPDSVSCNNAGTTESTSTSGSPSNTTSSNKCPSSYGTYRNSSNCAAFYVCVAGEPVNFYCPPGTNYNDELKVCDYIYRVNCSGIPSYPIPEPEESSTTIATETTPSSTNSTPSTPLSSTFSTTESTNVTISNTTESFNITTEYPYTSTLPQPQVTEEQIPSIPPPGVDPVALYNYNLKKLPESVVNTGVRCYHTNIFRLTPDCSSVTVCQDGLTYIVNCGHSTSFDALSQKCVPSFRARC